MALRAARHVERAADRELLAVVVERLGAVGTNTPVGVGDDGVVGPAVPQLAGDADELVGPVVAVVAVEEAAAAEVLAGERVGRRDRVPRRAAAAQVVEGGELAGQLEGLVERRVERGRQADPVGDGGQRGQHGQRVGPADDVEVEDPAPVLAQAQALGEEEEVELAPLGGAGEVDERREVGLAARRRVAPHRRVVDAGEVGGEVDLLARRFMTTTCARRSGWPAGEAEPVAQRGARRRPLRTVRPRSSGNDLVDEPVERVGQDVGRQEDAVDGTVAEPALDGRRHLGRRCRRDRSGRRSAAARRAPSRLAPSAVGSPTATVGQDVHLVGIASGVGRHGCGRARRARRARPGPARRRRPDRRRCRGERRSAPAPSASITTSGWPCGGRGVIDGPRTLKNRPSKST